MFIHNRIININSHTIYFGTSYLENSAHFIAIGRNNTKIDINFIKDSVELYYGNNSVSVFSYNDFNEWILKNKITIDPVIPLIFVFYNLTRNTVDCWNYSRACNIALVRAKSEVKFILENNESVNIIDRFTRCYDVILPSL